MDGYAAETSGGLFICLPKKDAVNFMSELRQEGIDSWEIGYVRDGDNSAQLEKVELLEI